MSVGRICGNIQKNYKSGYSFRLEEVTNDKNRHGMSGLSRLFRHMLNYYSH